MNYKKLPHAPENAQNFDGEDWCPGEAGARESQGNFKLEESRVYELCCLQVHFVCPGWLVPNTLLLILTVLFALRHQNYLAIEPIAKESKGKLPQCLGIFRKRSV